MIFFTDRDLGRSFPEILEAAGLQVRRHADLFRHDAADEEWLTEVGRNGWFALSRDKHIYYRPNEKEAVIHAKVGLFIVVGKAPHRELAENFVRSMRAIERFAGKHVPPFIAKVYRPSQDLARRVPPGPGKVALWYPDGG